MAPDEVLKLAGTGLPSIVQHFRPEDIAVIVAEKDGKVIATLSVVRIPHLEGLWIDPDHQNPGTTRSLLAMAEFIASQWSTGWAMAGAADDRMRGLLERYGAAKIPMDTYIVKLGRKLCRQPS